ncbi:MAG: ABC transporter ATP-binding protein [Bifidobacteriaceae bacterium]|jgi:ABC-2 type transport system ATP-binding protein|nr:ABC transporter ATP-binding protein [Bifidobacteriaceae bacterium]
MPDATIAITGLKKAFGRVQALDGVDLTVQPGEIYGFIGPNGAGKSTTIRVALGILKADAGRAAIFGQDAWRDAVAIHHRLSYVPGDVNLWPNLTGGEVIDLLVRLKKNGDRQYRRELIERFEFDPSKKCDTYSKGNRQKVALVAAFSTDADLYILDEPTSGLDPLMELVFRDCVRKVAAEGKTVFLSSHILSEVEQLCDRLSIIRQGRIVDTGSLREMQHLTRNQVHAEAPQPLSGLAGLPGVHDLEVKPGEATFRLDNAQTATVMGYLAAQGVTRVVSTPPTLEELFMSHYGDAADAAGSPTAATAAVPDAARLATQRPTTQG